MEKANLLIVDDDSAIREAMKEYFIIAGFNATTAKDGYETLEFIKYNFNQVDIVITDIMMPGMTGLELTDRIKSDYNIDVIVITGYTEDYSYEEAIKIGASDIIFKPVRFEELLLRIKRVLREKKVTQERNEMFKKLKKLAITDGLTGLFNSRQFYLQIEQEIDRFNRYKHPLSLLMLDIDHFKIFNDTYGHLEGDKVLIKMGEVITSSLRAMDSAYRYGGEEFAIFLPETSASEAYVVASRIKDRLGNHEFTPFQDQITHVTTSIGVTEYNPPESVHDFVARADMALYKAKGNGRNQVVSTLAERDQF